jgi:hypothetical protein
MRAILPIAAGVLTVVILLILALAGLERAAARMAPLTTPGPGSAVSGSPGS